MTNDEGREPEGAPERSPKLAQAPLRASTGMARSVFRSAQVGDRCALLRGERWTLGARQTNVSVARPDRVARSRAFAGAATALKERENGMTATERKSPG